MLDTAGMSVDKATAATARVLIAEDEEALSGLLATYLERAGFTVDRVTDGPAAVAAVRGDEPDVLVLDLGLPGLDGIEVCRQVRTFSDCYVLMLTARGDEIDRLVGLSVGADDYITKPFSPREVVARVQAVLRRPRRTGSPGDHETRSWTFGELGIDPAGRDVTLAGAPVDLTRTEFDILATLAQQPRLAFTRRQIVDRVWGEGWVGDEHVVDVHVANIRRKLADDSTRPRFILTVRGVGYRMGHR